MNEYIMPENSWDNYYVDLIDKSVQGGSTALGTEFADGYLFGKYGLLCIAGYQYKVTDQQKLAEFILRFE